MAGELITLTPEKKKALNAIRNPNRIVVDDALTGGFGRADGRSISQVIESIRRRVYLPEEVLLGLRNRVALTKVDGQAVNGQRTQGGYLNAPGLLSKINSKSIKL